MTDAAAGPTTTVDPPPSRRRRLRLFPRFGLRTLFVVAVVFCLLCGWIGRNLYRMRQGDAAIERLVHVGAVLYYAPEEGVWTAHPGMPEAIPGEPYVDSVEGFFESRLPRALGFKEPFHVSAVWFEKERGATDEVLDALRPFPAIEKVGLAGPGFTDAAIASLSDLPALRELSFEETRVTGAGLARFRSPERITAISAEFHDASSGIVEGLSAFPNLRRVDLRYTDPSLKGIEAISGLRRLETLSLTQSSLPESASLRSLVALPALRELGVANANLDAADLADIGRMKDLVRLKIIEPGITDGDLEHWTSLLKLRQLEIFSPATEEGARDLSRRLPECDVFYVRREGTGVLLRAGEQVPEDY